MARSCKKTHKRVSGVCVPNNVVNKSLYARIKKKISRRVKRKGQRWGAYTSDNLVQEYKRKGGKYRGRKRTFGSRKRKSRRRRKSRKSRKRRSRRRRRTKKRKSKRRNRVTGRVLRGIGNVVRKVPSTMITKGKNISKISDKKAIERLKDAYELDDKYRDKLKQMYWKKKPIYRNPNNLRSFRIRRK